MEAQKSHCTPKQNALTPFINSRGKAYMFPFSDGRITKKEHEKDRLRVFGGKAYAIDALDLRKALDLGMKTLVIKETTLKGGKVRRYEISLSEIREKERPIHLAGVERYPIYLSRCVLTSGEPEAWQLAERQALLKVESARTEKERSQPKQAGLFDDQSLIEAAQSERLRQAG